LVPRSVFRDRPINSKSVRNIADLVGNAVSEMQHSAAKRWRHKVMKVNVFPRGFATEAFRLEAETFVFVVSKYL
jgi:hypothetical protein